MATANPKLYYKVGVLLFDRADVLDFTGPMEVLSHVSHNRNPDQPDRMFTFETIAQTSTIRAANVMNVEADRLLEEAERDLAEYDILIVPGGPPAVVKPLIEGNAPEVDMIRKFAALPLSSSRNPRILFSICTGAFLLGRAGILSGMTVTTHHRGVDVLRDICARFGDKNEPPVNVVHKRYTDGNLLKGRSVQLITAGGISSGLDATFHVVRQLSSPDMAAFVSRVMEYDWTEQGN
ncbi:ThiJ/PfpI family protein [Penicillium argentinense]|uniref:ThiJ/PfpI family protein n=1 Tax=Penicillium argentinense TaxID=1131581 RepID=A0A9W9EW50_9EURO|nr:ThiJ/PfpI family protein [Penicillium argentinense]KAJ5089077.1 ThiJ/PfpI family protein [Penicillium argentinense]